MFSFITSQYYSEERAKLLLSKDVEKITLEELEVSVNADLQTLLHIASSKGDLLRFEQLIAKGSNIHATDKFGKTSLMIACENCHVEVVNKLIALGADIALISTHGTNCFHYAAIVGNENIIRKLLEMGMDPNLKCYDVALLFILLNIIK